MILGKSVLAIIPARGGSKGVMRKNIRKLRGKPLIAWAIEEAKKSVYIDRLILSSDDEEIIEVAKQWNCEVPFLRPQKLAEDNTPGIEVVLHALGQVKGYDYIVLLQPTSPFRSTEDIDGCIEKCLQKKASSCVSVAESAKPPYWMYRINGDRLEPIMQSEAKYSRRQDCPKTYALNGAVYVANTNMILQKRTFVDEFTVGYVMPEIRSIDIDSEWDFTLCEFIIAQHENGGT